MKTERFYKVYSYPSGTDAALRAEIEDLRLRGAKGGYIIRHRAMLTSRRGWRKALTGAARALALFICWL